MAAEEGDGSRLVCILIGWRRGEAEMVVEGVEGRGERGEAEGHEQERVKMT